MISKTRNPSFSKKELVLIVSSVAAAAFLLEIVLRIWLNYFSTDKQFRRYSLYTDVAPENTRWSPHHYLNYYPTPGYKKGLTYHNSLGYRSEEFEIPKPESIYRIVTLGGSTTYTVNVKDNKKTFPYQLEKILNKEYAYQDIEVINAGVGGYNSWESLINLQFRVLDTEPDLIIVYHGTNDVHTRLVSPQTYQGDNSGRRKQWSPPAIPLIEYSVLLRIISRKLGWTHQVGVGSFVNAATFQGADGSGRWSAKKSNAAELLRENPPVFFKRNLINMVSIARAHDVDVMLVTWAYNPHLDDYASTEVYQSGFEENNAVVKEVAEKYQTPVFDFASVMPTDNKYWTDGRHVNEQGALLKAELFADFIHTTGLIDEQRAQQRQETR